MITSPFVVVYYRGRHVVITLQPFFESFCVVVATLDEGFASDVVFHGNFGRMICEMVGTSRRGVD